MIKQISNIQEVAYIREYKFTAGKEKDVEVIEIFNGILRILLNKSKALDILQLFYKGKNMSLITKNGISNSNGPFIDRFEGGMLYTVGFDSAGGREGFEIHGSFHNLTPTITKKEISDRNIVIEAYIEDTKLFGKHLVLKRRYTLGLNDNFLLLEDVLINKDTKPENYCILYHNNLGYPMLDENDEIIINNNLLIPRTKYAKETIKTWNIMGKAMDEVEETCYFIDVIDGKAVLNNHKENIQFVLEYSKDTLPEFVLWKQTKSGDFALGFEPSTTKLDDMFRYSSIKPNEKIKFKLKYTFDDLKH